MNSLIQNLQMIQPPLIGNWSGSVFIFPNEKKYSENYVKKIYEHGNGILLIHAETNRVAFQKYVLKRAHSLYFIQGNLKYFSKPMVLVAYGQQNSGLLKHCKVEGFYVPLIRRYQKRNREYQTEKLL